ncbi:MAG: methoxymalonyl-ACP biosynthesis protein, partial [Gluconacetobacter diazotrophicus]|nr:methoxymalonyl-ACP biosynthesis protein [Gluconacetobacter diazotrophicus]
MPTRPSMPWLPEAGDVRARLPLLPAMDPVAARSEIRALANRDLDFVQTNALDRRAAAVAVSDTATPPVRLAVLGSATTDHLHAAIRVAGLRRGLRLSIHQPDFNQYRAAVLDRGSSLHAFAPDFVLFALDAAHVCAGIHPALSEAEAADALDDALSGLAALWDVVRDEMRATVVQQTVIPSIPPLMGSNEHRLPGSPAAFVARFNAALRERADRHGVHLLALDDRI